MPLVTDFYSKARYLLDLGATKPVNRRVLFEKPDRPDLGTVLGKAEVLVKGK